MDSLGPVNFFKAQAVWARCALHQVAVLPKSSELLQSVTCAHLVLPCLRMDGLLHDFAYC